MLVVMGVAGVAVLLALVLVLGEANKQRDRALALQSHSYEVMILARTLAGTIARSEASLGRYVISADQSLGQLYYDDWRLAGNQIDRLGKLTYDNDGQSVMIAQLRRAYRTRGAELSLTALSTNYGQNPQALSRYYNARKAASLAEINQALDAIIINERGVLDVRTTKVMASVHRSTVYAKVLALFGLLIVCGAIALGWLMVRAIAQRTVAEAEAEDERERADELARAVTKATDELRVQEARLRQVQKMEAVGQLTGGIAHDFNNMLAVVMGGIELARRGLAVKSKDVDRHLESAEEGAVRAAALTKRLLAFARETAINPERVDAAALFDDIRDLIERTLGDRITVTLIDDSAGWATRADRVQFENTIVNLAVNARDAMDGSGKLTIEAATEVLGEGAHDCAPGEYLTIAVRDTGCGMSAETIDRVFEPFFTTKPVGKGTGLGLSQIFAFTRQIGGQVTITSVEGAGTIVTLFLPRDVSEPVVATVAPVVELAAPILDAAPLRILVVEDDPRVLAATVGAIEELGHHVIACADPLSAPALLASNLPIDLILSDVLMPARTGPEMIAALDPAHAAIPVLFVTGFAGDASGGVDLGGRPVLRKPFTLAALDHAIASIASGDRGDTPHQIAAE